MPRTPGPWTVSTQGPAQPGIYTIKEARRNTTTEAEQAANAALIASAPELLAALESLLNSIDEGELRPFAPAFDPSGIRELTRDRISAARHAVARAEGLPPLVGRGELEGHHRRK